MSREQLELLIIAAEHGDRDAERELERNGVRFTTKPGMFQSWGKFFLTLAGNLLAWGLALALLAWMWKAWASR